MPLWLVPIITWLSHNVARFIGVVAIGALLIGGPLVAYKSIKTKAYNEGYKAGYSQAVTDHPQITGTGHTIITGQDKKDPWFIFLKLGKFNLLAI